ncbi:fatty-acyl-CoA synthase [Dethiosulfatibacter aminovorans DSM 17477]|uniref:Fatty-acyl-CoA synthase n=1 Tax=Dethiosulfatibacter aminovorans DSM 17477 TaxID=1121476 RepID=A0A1M6MBE8_9FIRM|nr:AMP-binding protein [Dethiosulfatibacter aminovorans]SHJ80791.1 fatty-acyl-CoA synthase [Dethiosulfatibacter aminovorans DSM 17477]
MENNSWIGNYSFFRSRISPEKEAVYDYDNEIHYTYGDLENRANTLANFLVEKVHVKKGDRIGFCTRNCIELIDAYFATAKTGTILVTYNQLLSEHELEKMIINEKPKVLFYEKTFKDKVSNLKLKVQIEKYIVLAGESEKLEELHYEEILDYKNSSYIECNGLNLEDTHMIIHTGGTTGTPKGAMLSYKCLLFNAISEMVTYNLTSQDSTYVMMPLFHTGAWNVLTLPLLFVGGRIIINKSFDPQLALKVINDEKPTTLLGVSTIFRMMINQSEFEATDFSSLRWILSGAAPTPVDIMEKFWEKDLKFVLGYGMTEAGPNNLSMVPDDLGLEGIKEKYDSVGKPMFFNQVKIVDTKGKEVGVNELGEIIWKGPLTFSGYWNNKEETSNTLKDGWVYTGDIARKDNEGFYYIVGRKKNMFISGGENIYPPEVEKEIYKHPSIHEVCVIGIPHKKWGEVGKAIVSSKSGEIVEEKEIKEFLKGKIASIKIPRYVEIVDELPKNSTGKIKREVICNLYG